MVKAVKINLNWLFNNPKMVPIKTTNCPIQLITENFKKLSPLEHIGRKKSYWSLRLNLVTSLWSYNVLMAPGLCSNYIYHLKS